MRECLDITAAAHRFETVLFDPAFKQEMEPLFFDYFKTWVTTKEGIRAYFNIRAKIAKLVNIEGKEVIDIGCGFGLTLICCSLLGAKRSLGVDVSKEMVRGFRKLLTKFDPPLNVRVECGDWLLMNHGNNSFDVVILYEAISHIRDTSLLLYQIQKVLRPGGILFISDCNNDLFITSRLRSRRNWRRSEYGPINVAMSKQGQEVDRLPFFNARIKIIRQLCPSLDEYKTIAKKTRGMYGDEIRYAVEEFMATGSIRQRASFPYRNPFTGEYPELGINPLKLVRILTHLEFRCRFVPPFWREDIQRNEQRAKPIFRTQVKVITGWFLKASPHWLLPFLTPDFRIVATKTK